MVDEKLIEKKIKSMFKDADYEVKSEGKSLKVSLEGIGEDPVQLFEKIGDLVSGLNKITGTKNADVIVSLQGMAYGVEIEVY